jgi:hypothetical protein
MACQRCGRACAAWLDTYADEAVCEGCCPDRSGDYGMAFVQILNGADARRLAAQDNNGED